MRNKEIKIVEKSRNKESEILKQNNLIECSFKELQTWSEIHHDLLNEIIAIFQYYEYKDVLFEEMKNRIFIRRLTLEKNLNIRRKSNQEIFSYLKKMRDTSFVVKGIYQPNGYKTTATISFFNFVYLHEKVGRESYFEIEYTDLFALLCNKKYSLDYGNYTKIDLKKTLPLKSKYAKALYELVEANKYKTKVVFSEEELKSFLRYNVKHYRFAGLVREIDKVYESVNFLIKFKYIPHKATKTITIIIT